jgi:hypothetical protein
MKKQPAAADGNAQQQGAAAAALTSIGSAQLAAPEGGPQAAAAVAMVTKPKRSLTSKLFGRLKGDGKKQAAAPTGSQPPAGQEGAPAIGNRLSHPPPSFARRQSAPAVEKPAAPGTSLLADGTSAAQERLQEPAEEAAVPWCAAACPSSTQNGRWWRVQRYRSRCLAVPTI